MCWVRGWVSVRGELSGAVVPRCGAGTLSWSGRPRRRLGGWMGVGGFVFRGGGG